MLLIEVVNTKSGISSSSVGLFFCCCWLLALVYVVPFACSASMRKLVKVICSYYCRYYFNSCGCIAVIEVDFSAYYIPRIVCSDNLILFTFIIGGPLKPIVLSLNDHCIGIGSFSFSVCFLFLFRVMACKPF